MNHFVMTPTQHAFMFGSDQDVAEAVATEVVNRMFRRCRIGRITLKAK